MVELIEVFTISVYHPEVVTFYDLCFDHADDFLTFVAIAVYELDGIPKGIARFNGCHKWGLSGKLRFNKFKFNSLGYLQ